MNILMASAHLPSASGRQAGAKTSYAICEHLSRRHRLRLLSFANTAEISHFNEKEMGIFESWELFPVTQRSRMFGILASPGLPFAVGARTSGSYSSRLRASLLKEPANVVIFDHTAMFQYADVVHRSGSNAICVGSAHDILTQFWTRRAAGKSNAVTRAPLAFESGRIRRWESRAFASLDLLLVQCEKDKQIVHALRPDAQVMTIAPSILRFDRLGGNDHRELGAVLFWGAMNRDENITAARWAANVLLPKIRERVPNARLYIAGSHGEALEGEFSGRSDVVITGYVEDVGSLMSRMRIALLPLTAGAGIKVKTLECMAAGLPVVTTPVGAEGVDGIPGVHYCVGENAAQLIDHSVNLLVCAEEAQRMGKCAEDFMTRKHNIGQRLESLESYLQSILGNQEPKISTTSQSTHG